jgi:hypothetical protein
MTAYSRATREACAPSISSSDPAVLRTIEAVGSRTMRVEVTPDDAARDSRKWGGRGVLWQTIRYAVVAGFGPAVRQGHERLIAVRFSPNSGECSSRHFRPPLADLGAQQVGSLGAPVVRC